ncbi:MAG: alpha/beta hydrolase [Phyllobacteriaceae bacterium]|nr:alpha/beta hydrolase [Phyllobacteriaceae bacterium]
MRLAVSILIVLASVAPSAAQSLAPFKDNLFAYPAILSTADGGAYRVVDYSEARDIDKRDEIPERRVWSKYVSLGVRKLQKDLVAETPAGRIAHVAVGKTEGAGLIVFYIHGKGGDRKQGVNDHTFGGNFNRLKNLVVSADGVYISADFSGFDTKGVAEIAALASRYAAKSPGAPVIVACGSMGGAICYGLAARPDTGISVSGYLLLGAFPDDALLASAAVKARKPVFFAHGSADKVFAVAGQEALFRTLRAKGDYPARFVRFETGTHGTPVRMIDWRDTLNWMLAAR